MAESVAYNMDCLTAMRQMPDKAFDLAVVDPPYGLGEHGGNAVADMCCRKTEYAYLSQMVTTKRSHGIWKHRHMNISSSYVEFQRIR